MRDVVTGNVVVEAESIEAATELAMAYPVFDVDGSVEVWPLPVQEGADTDTAALRDGQRAEPTRRRELA